MGHSRQARVMNAAIAICVWLLSLSMVAYAVYKNLRTFIVRKYIRAEIIQSAMSIRLKLRP